MPNASATKARTLRTLTVAGGLDDDIYQFVENRPTE
jgi:hypothetical protein